MSRNTFERHVYLLLVGGKEDKRHYVLIGDFSTFLYNHKLHRGRKHFFIIVYKLLAQKKYQNVVLMIALKLIVNKG